MTQSSNDLKVSAEIDELGAAKDALISLASNLSKLNAANAVAHKTTKAMSRSLQQIVFVSRNNGSIQHEKIMDIVRKSGFFDLWPPGIDAG